MDEITEEDLQVAVITRKTYWTIGTTIKWKIRRTIKRKMRTIM
jgi:hypothetical protein